MDDKRREVRECLYVSVDAFLGSCVLRVWQHRGGIDAEAAVVWRVRCPQKLTNVRSDADKPTPFHRVAGSE